LCAHAENNAILLLILVSVRA